MDFNFHFPIFSKRAAPFSGFNEESVYRVVFISYLKCWMESFAKGE